MGFVISLFKVNFCTSIVKPYCQLFVYNNPIHAQINPLFSVSTFQTKWTKCSGISRPPKNRRTSKSPPPRSWTPKRTLRRGLSTSDYSWTMLKARKSSCFSKTITLTCSSLFTMPSLVLKSIWGKKGRISPKGKNWRAFCIYWKRFCFFCQSISEENGSTTRWEGSCPNSFIPATLGNLSRERQCGYFCYGTKFSEMLRANIYMLCLQPWCRVFLVHIKYVIYFSYSAPNLDSSSWCHILISFEGHF